MKHSSKTSQAPLLMTNMSLDQAATPSTGDGVEVVQDEGYSEDPLSRNGLALSASSAASRPRGLSNPTPQALAAASMNFDVDDRISVVLQLLRTMPAAKVQDIVNAMYPILHISFLDRLPQEVCLKILGFLDPDSLIRLARTSKLGANLSFDWTLWQDLYYREGFLINDKELRKFEQELAESNERLKQTQRSRPSTSNGAPPKKRSRPTPAVSQDQCRNQDFDMADGDSTCEEQSSIFGAPSVSSGSARHDGDDSSDKPIFSPQPLSPPLFRRHESNASSIGRIPAPDFVMPSKPSLTTLDRFTNSRRLNWQFLYTQRRKIEQNWQDERYTTYQLPHPDHPEEGHLECVYTIQHDGRHLVSGSRDRTVRVWSLDTYRLKYPPIKGHEGSVLCLQFDPSPEEDIIITGGSDHTVRMWRFSTGRPLHVLRGVHEESVLNLKFNSHILVTCSKDKTLKIFNRQILHPGDLGYKLPKDFVYKPVPQVVNFPGLVPCPYGDLPSKKPYTLMRTLEGHGAAINACQILGNEIVSASGDRLAKVWDWPSGVCTRSLVGHTKGVACIQYDGRRIVTGSSDCEIKIFDRQTGVEVASLRGQGGHTALVRTVQAGFADVASEEEDRRKAFAVDNKFFGAWGERPDNETTKWAMDARSRKTGNAGSERPEDIVCYGAALPPGGGGGRYARIVSGSYDQTIIIWRRDNGGLWKPKTVLRQADAGRAALLHFQLQLPQPTSRDQLNPILATIQTPVRTQAWARELIQKLIAKGPEALRQGIAEYPMIMELVHHMLRLIRVVGTVIDDRDTRVLVEGGLALRNLMRAIVHAAMYQEIEKVQNQLKLMENEEFQLRSGIQASERAIEAAAFAERHDQDLSPEQNASQRRRAVYQNLEQTYQMRSGQLDGAQAMGGTLENGLPGERSHASREDTDANMSSSNKFIDAPTLEVDPLVIDAGPETDEATSRQEEARHVQMHETRKIAHLRQKLKELNKSRDSARSAHRHLRTLLEEVDQPPRRAADTTGAAAAGLAGNEPPPPAQERDRNWEGRVFKLQFDARRIICASSNPIILIWDFAKEDRDIETASRFFRGVE